MKLGAQLYTLRNYLQNEPDIRRSLGMVSAMGYKTVQVSGMAPINPSVLRSITDEEGLEIVLTHSPADRILNDTDRLIEEHKILGCRYIGLGSMPDKYRNEYWVKYFAEDYLPAARKIKAAGMKFMYHNHHFEFQRVHDRLLLDHILEGFTPDEMGITVDTYWLQAAGCDVVAWLEILKDRIDCVHLKDMQVEGNTAKFAPVGSGNMNFPAILEKLQSLGTTEHILVEQDTVDGSPFDALQSSYDYLNKLGY